MAELLGTLVKLVAFGRNVMIQDELVCELLLGACNKVKLWEVKSSSK